MLSGEMIPFTGRVKVMRIVGGDGCYGRRLLPYDETQQRITVNERGQVWLSRYDRAPCPFDPDQLVSLQYFRVSGEAASRLMNIASEFFGRYGYECVRDAQQWSADLVNTAGEMFHTAGAVGHGCFLVTPGLTNVVREELGIPDLLLVGDDAWDEADIEEPVYCWYETAPFEDVFRLAESGLDSEHNRRVELLRALEWHYWDYEGPDVDRIRRLQRLMHRYVVSLEAERPVRRGRHSFSWKEMAEE